MLVGSSWGDAEKEHLVASTAVLCQELVRPTLSLSPPIRSLGQLGDQCHK